MGGVAGRVVDGVSHNEAIVFSPGGEELVRYRRSIRSVSQERISITVEATSTGFSSGRVSA